MATVYSTQFIAAAGVDGTIVYEVPAGFRAVVRAIDCYANVSVAAREIHVIGANGQTFFWRDWNTGDQSSEHLDTRQVLDAGQTLTVQTSDLVDVSISGYLLSLP